MRRAVSCGMAAFALAVPGPGRGLAADLRGWPAAPDIEARLARREWNPALTPREVPVVERVAQGMRTRETGAAPAISEDTAHVRVEHIVTTLHVRDRTAAVGVALKRAILHLT